MQELNSSIREWARLGPLESFLKCDIIAGKLGSLRMIIQEFYGIRANVKEVSSLTVGDLLTPLIDISISQRSRSLGR